MSHLQISFFCWVSISNKSYCPKCITNISVKGEFGGWETSKPWLHKPGSLFSGESVNSRSWGCSSWLLATRSWSLVPQEELAHSFLCLHGWLHVWSEELMWKRIAASLSPGFCCGRKGCPCFFLQVLQAFWEKEYAFGLLYMVSVFFQQQFVEHLVDLSCVSSKKQC